MSLVLVTAPTVEPVTVDEAKQYLRVEHANDDATIEVFLRAAREDLDGKDGWLNRALITQTWDLVLDAFPCDLLRVPLPPLQSVTSITYLDTAGATQTWSSAKYLVDIKSQPGRILPAYGEIFPTTRVQANAVTVRFVAGYGADGGTIPERLKLGMKALVSHFYENREPVVVGGGTTTAVVLPMHVERLLLPYRVWLS